MIISEMGSKFTKKSLDIPLPNESLLKKIENKLEIKSSESSILQPYHVSNDESEGSMFQRKKKVLFVNSNNFINKEDTNFDKKVPIIPDEKADCNHGELKCSYADDPEIRETSSIANTKSISNEESDTAKIGLFANVSNSLKSPNKEGNQGFVDIKDHFRHTDSARERLLDLQQLCDTLDHFDKAFLLFPQEYCNSMEVVLDFDTIFAVNVKRQRELINMAEQNSKCIKELIPRLHRHQNKIQELATCMHRMEEKLMSFSKALYQLSHSIKRKQ